MLKAENITKLDSQHMLESIDQLSQQVSHAWESVKDITVPKDYKDFDNIVVFGMGGSALGADIARHLFSDSLKKPLFIHNDYSIPAWVNERSLVILSSYSGTTEEVVEVSKTIAERTKKIMVVTTGGKLQEYKDEHSLPGYSIDPKHNPCGQPRIAVGYAATGLFGLLRAVGAIELTDQDIDDIVHFLDGNRELLRDEAMTLANKMQAAFPMYIGSEFLEGNIHVTTNQTNENGKHLAARHNIPELNHHLLEGLEHPEALSQQLHVVFVESSLYHVRNQKRYRVTQKVLDKQKINHSTFVPTGRSQLLQSFEVLQWGGYLSFYMAIANEVDPSPIPWVDYFKDALRKP